jgi:hypothetical protein
MSSSSPSFRPESFSVILASATYAAKAAAMPSAVLPRFPCALVCHAVPSEQLALSTQSDHTKSANVHIAAMPRASIRRVIRLISSLRMNLRENVRMFPRSVSV